MSTVAKVMLVKVSSADNNNKFYEIRLDDAGVVHKRWGRVGADGQRGRESTGLAGFEKLKAAKMRRGYTEVAVVGSGKANGAAVNTAKLGQVSRKALAADSSDRFVGPLIDRLVEKNRHEILTASGGLIEVSADGVLETALGIIEPSSLQAAGRLLDRLQGMDASSRQYRSALEEYLSLVPQKLPARRGWETDFFTTHPISEQRSLLAQLGQSYDWYQNERDAQQQGDADDGIDYSSFFRYRLRTVDLSEQGRATFRHINSLFRGSRNQMHRDVYGKQLRRVYALEAAAGTDVYEKVSAKLGNVQELWHGTQVANILSILRKGLYVPPVSGSSIQTTGRMFGDGVYFSNQSTKALNYSHGFWSGTRQTDCFMFLADVVCGREYRPQHWSSYRQAYNGYDCIWVKAGTAGVRNNEVIVWNTDQIRLGWLCEFH